MASYEADQAVRREIRGEQTSSLARAGRALEAALEELSGARGALRADALAEAAERLWFVVIQREAMGLFRHDHVYEVYRVPREVRAAMGPRRAETAARR
jgi:hypothetical protein